VHAVLDPGSALVHRELVHASGVEVRGLDVQPIQAFLSEGPGVREHERAAAYIGAEVVEVHVHGVRPASEVDVVREVDPFLVAHLLRDLELDEKIAPLRVQLAVALLGAVQRVDKPGDVLPRGQRRRRELPTRPPQPVGIRGPGGIGNSLPRWHVRSTTPGGPHLLHHL
jgi:hypothetical protein